jgi:glycine cleavage system T protein (aminomethyltransferase)
MGEETGQALRRTPLDARHRALGAKMGAFAGWDMPIEYAGTLTEHRAVREAVGLFDLTHLGKIDISGPGAADLLQQTMPNDISKVDVGGAQYNMVLNGEGGVVDDLINYRVAGDRWLTVPNAANTAAVYAVLVDQPHPAADARLRDDLCLLAPQGPRSIDLVARVFPDAQKLAYMNCAEMTYRNESMVVSRSGYTGERGFELFVPGHLAAALWDELLEQGKPLGIEPCGLGARDTLRLEMGYPLHGNDIGPDRTPFEAGLMWAVALDKGVDFPGRAAILAQRDLSAGPDSELVPRVRILDVRMPGSVSDVIRAAARGRSFTVHVPARLWGLRMKDRLIPRPHYAVLADGERVGETTSGTFSPTLKVGIAMAYLSPRDRFKPGDDVQIDVRGRSGTAEVVKLPFVDSSPR